MSTIVQDPPESGDLVAVPPAFPATSTAIVPFSVPETVLKRNAITAIARADGPQTLDRLKSWQRDTMDARLAILQFIEVYALERGIGISASIKETVDLGRRGLLPPHIQALILRANAKPGKSGSRTLCTNTLFSWRAQQKKHGNSAVAPKPGDRSRVPAWVASLMGFYRVPQKPSLQAALRSLKKSSPPGVEIPTYREASYFLKKYVSIIERNRGRESTRELRKYMAFIHRDVSKIPPFSVYMADGHTFKAEVAHPFTGKPFRPEITSVIDVKTKFLCGLSAGLAESGLEVLAALSRAIEACGFPGVFCADNGSGYVNAMMEKDVSGFLARFSITPWHSFPYNSQEQGAIERTHRTIWVEAAKQLAPYVGRDMDKHAAKRFYKVTREQIKKTGSSSLLPTWESFVELLWTRRHEYNHSPHRALPKIADPETGIIRHQSPAESVAQAIKEGLEQYLPTPEESSQLYRPQKQCRVVRGEVTFGKKTYFNIALEEHSGQTVNIGYDPYDPARVCIYTMEQEFICVADLDANRRDFIPQSEVERAHEKRVKGRQRRNEIRGQRIREELERVIVTESVDDLTPEQIARADAMLKELEAPRTYDDDLTPEQIARADAMLAAMEARQTEDDDPVSDEIKYWRWANAHREDISEEQRQYLDERMERNPEFRMLLQWKDGGETLYRAPGLRGRAPWE